MACPRQRFEFDGVQLDRLTRAQVLDDQPGTAARITQPHLHIGEFAADDDPVGVHSCE